MNEPLPLMLVGPDFAPPARTSFSVETLGDLLATPEPEWLLDGILPRGVFVLIYGPSGCGKSFLAQDMAFHLALKRPWFGREVDDRAGVLYVAAEAGGGTAKRVKAFHQHHEIAKDCVPLWFIRQPVDLLNPSTADDIYGAFEDTLGLPEVIIFDTLYRCLPGGNENSPEDMTAAIAMLDHIRQSTNSTIIVVHHTPLSEKDRPRGHSSLIAAADTAIMVEKAGDIRTATVQYQRDGEEGARLTFRLQQVETGQDKHLRPVTSCVVEPIESDAAAPDRPLTKTERAAYDALVAVIDRLPKPDSDTSYSGQYSRTSPKCPVVSWRDEFRRRQVDGPDIKPDSLLKRFKRAADALESRGKVGVYDDKAWIIWNDRT